MLTVGVDASVLEPVRTGVGNYVFNLLTSYRRVRPDTSLYLFSDRALADDAKPLGRSFEHIGPRFIKKGPLWMSSGLLPLLRKHRVDVFWGGNGWLPIVVPSRTARVVTVHDFVYLRAGATVPAISRWTRRVLQPLAIEQADAVACVSQATAREVREVCGRVADAVLEPQIDPSYRRATEDAMREVRACYGLPERFLLAVGTLEPRKNFGALLRAYVRLRSAGVPLPLLAVAGKTGWLAGETETLLAAATQSGFVKALGYVPLEHMPALYSTADAFVFVPVYEGFGMPVREALACGTPVIAADIPALREAAGDSALFVAPDEPSIERMLAGYASGVRRPPAAVPQDFDSSERTAVAFAELLDRAAARRRS